MSTRIRRINKTSFVDKTAPRRKVAKKLELETELVKEEVLASVSQPNAMVELANAAKLVNAKLVNSGNVVAKSPVKKVAKSPVKKQLSSTKKPAGKHVSSKKSPKPKVTKKPEVNKPATKKVSAKTVPGCGKSKSVKKSKSKRPHNTKPTPLDTTGVGIGPARVKAVLMNKSLNPREFSVRNAIKKAENKPKKPKPTDEEPDPPLPPQGPQVPVCDLDESVLAVIQEAEAVHKSSIREGYERCLLTAMSDPEASGLEDWQKSTLSLMKNKDKVVYLSTRKTAHAELNAANANLDESVQSQFDLEAFNTKFDKNFYAGYEQYVTENDSYVVGAKYTEWSRVSALVNKLCTRLSGNTRNLVASFLDCIVEQYAFKGIVNCLSEGRHIVLLRHAITHADSSDARIPLDSFVKTFENYSIALNWIDACKEVREEVATLKAEGKGVEFTYPVYPELGYDYDFEGYVGEICRSVKMRLSEDQVSDEDKSKYLDTSVSREFKKFCSYVVYEAILRIGACLRKSVERSGVKTISDTMVKYVLEQIHNVCGMDYDVTDTVMTNRLEQFAKWRIERKDERRLKKLHKESALDDTLLVDEAGAEDVDETETETEQEPDAEDGVAEKDAEDEEEEEDDEVEVEVEYENA
jgi:hypothetical protein